jgi:hypothetical protein
MTNQKRKTKRGTMCKETYMETAKEVSVKAFNLRKSSAKYAANLMVLQRFSKYLNLEGEIRFIRIGLSYNSL